MSISPYCSSLSLSTSASRYDFSKLQEVLRALASVRVGEGSEHGALSFSSDRRHVLDELALQLSYAARALRVYQRELPESYGVEDLPDLGGDSYVMGIYASRPLIWAEDLLTNPEWEKARAELLHHVLGRSERNESVYHSVRHKQEYLSYVNALQIPRRAQEMLDACSRACCIVQRHDDLAWTHVELDNFERGLTEFELAYCAFIRVLVDARETAKWHARSPENNGVCAFPWHVWPVKA